MSSSDRGFTLVELMVALTLLGLIATMLAAATRLSLDLSRRGDAKVESMNTTQLQRTLLRNQLEGALPFHYWNQVNGTRTEFIAFDGSSDRLRFVSREGVNDGPNSIPRWIDIREDAETNGVSNVVVEERRILSPDNQPSEDVTARTTVLHCISLRLEYLDASTEQPQWKSAWSGPERTAPLPSAIRLQCRNTNDAVTLLVPLDYAEAAKQGMSLQ